jgi:C-terminal processing protease CtpA/Prc
VILRKDQPDLTIDAKASKEVVEGISQQLKEAYVFPETAQKMESELRRRLDKNEYEEIKSAQKLAKVLTEHLQAISKDKHLRVFYAYEPIPEQPQGKEPKPGREKRDEMRERMRAHGRSLNYGFEKVERLEGNVGYLDLRMFMPAELGGETAAAAMNLLANTDALIIDVRKNGGGAPSMVALICSYLFGPEPVHLNDLYFRPEDSTHQWWTLSLVPGQRYEGKPVYVLTSKRTFSAAEEFTYNLKSLKRATIVGETTGGGAHPGGMRRINEHFGMFVPSGRAINPITKTNWEGTGVTPDLPVAAERALPTAHLAALKTIAEHLAERQKDPKTADPIRVDQVKKAIERLEKELAESKKNPKAETAQPPKD